MAVLSFAAGRKRTATMNRRKRKGRNSLVFLHLSRFAACHSSVTIIAALLQCPAFFSSCSRVRETPAPSRKVTQIYLQSTKNTTADAVDLFFFDPSGAQNLDAYQQITDWNGSNAVYGLSGTGAKHLVALSGTAGETGRWWDIRNYGSLCKYTFSLADDSPDKPLLVGETDLQDALSRQLTLPLHPMLCQIRIRSVSCNFAGRPYAGADFRNSACYLAYAGTECFPVGTGDRPPASWINAGVLDSIALNSLPQPEMIAQEGWGSTGNTPRHPSRSLYCYPHPLTQVVLAGTLADMTCYYPIPLPDLQAGQSYELDITLRRMGSARPDIPVQSDAYPLQMEALPWDEHNTQTIPF